MTIRELMENLERYLSIDPKAADFPVYMAGHDANGERQYEIPAMDTTFDCSNGYVTIWDK